MTQSTMQDYERIFQVKGHWKDGNLIFHKHRKLRILIEDISVIGGDVTEVMISFTPQEGKILIIGEIPCFPEEFHDLEVDLLSIGATVSAIHNHWIFTNPSIYYMHFQLVTSDSLRFAQRYARIWSKL